MFVITNATTYMYMEKEHDFLLFLSVISLSLSREKWSSQFTPECSRVAVCDEEWKTRQVGRVQVKGRKSGEARSVHSGAVCMCGAFAPSRARRARRT